ncbi:MAG: tRNA (adenosine(37)-N6)-threonylcarbamoyltransferase complex transferase subunit TsaD [Planctomycetota bacterium]
MKILGLESSCDDTACALVEDGGKVLSNIVSSQDELHERFGGVVPEVACRRHIKNVLPVMKQALDEGGVEWKDVDAVAATRHPGLIGALLICLTAAKSVSWALDVPLMAVNHLDAHIYGGWMGGMEPHLPAVSMVVSGGHTSLYHTTGPLQHDLLGSTVDDAAGEAFDKVAKILHLGFPGGPVIEEVAREGDPEAFDLPRAMMDGESVDFSFSGLKTAVLYHAVGQNASMEDIKNASYSGQFVADMAASFQESVVDVLVTKTRLAVQKVGAEGLIVGGGVAANSVLRERLSEMADREGLQINLAPWSLCRDNAAMVAGVGYHMYESGHVADLSVEASP